MLPKVLAFSVLNIQGSVYIPDQNVAFQQYYKHNGCDCIQLNVIGIEVQPNIKIDLAMRYSSSSVQEKCLIMIYPTIGVIVYNYGADI
jgi:hypothetical protein